MHSLKTEATSRSGWLIPLSRMLRDRRGAGAVEFALIVPILLMIYICAFELTLGLSVSKRATRAAGTVADIVTQQTAVTKSYLGTMKDAAAAIFVPYSTSGLTLRISGITIDANKKATILWSWAQDNTRPYAIGSSVTVPTDLLTPSTFLVRSELSVNHQLLMFMANTLSLNASTLTISREYFFRQRIGEFVSCSDC